MNDLVNQLITTGVGEALLGFAYLLWLITGVANATFNTKTWSWKKTGTDLAKAILMAIVILGLVVLSNGLEWFAGMLGFDITAFTDGMSTVTILGGIIGGAALYYSRAVKNAINFFKLDTSMAKLKEGAKLDYAGIAESTMEIVNGIVTAITTPKEVVEAQEEFEQEGGRGAVYVVPINTYDAFRSAVIGKGYDLDNAYGYQCWDGCALLWQQLGKSLITGNGCASGCWNLKREVNKYDQFELITDKTKIKKGDVLVFSAGTYGHIGFADEDYNNASYIKLLGQNQGGTPGATGGATFNVINMSLASFLGGFRYKGWVTNTDKKPVEPAKPVESNGFKEGDKVIPTKLVDYDGRKLTKHDSVYTIKQIRGDRVVLEARGKVWAAMRIDDIKHA